MIVLGVVLVGMMRRMREKQRGKKKGLGLGGKASAGPTSRHCSLGAANLTLDLLASPASSLDGPRLKVAVGLGLFDHGADPVLTEDIGQLAVGVGIGKIAVAGQ